MKAVFFSELSSSSFPQVAKVLGHLHAQKYGALVMQAIVSAIRTDSSRGEPARFVRVTILR
jgi:hypothetical protein